MSIDRRIDLNIGLAREALQQQPGHADTGQRRGPAPESDRQAFERALQAEPEAPAERADEAPRPFALFGAAAAPLAGASSQPDATAGEAAELGRTLAASAERLLVSEDGGNGREVRIDLKDELLPGVSVRIYEDQGRLVTAFVCASEDARERLNAWAPGFAAELAQSLRREVLVQVQTDDPEDLRLFETVRRPE